MKLKYIVMQKVNELLSLLDCCQDEEFIDDVCSRVGCNDPFDEDDIAAEYECDD